MATGTRLARPTSGREPRPASEQFAQHRHEPVLVDGPVTSSAAALTSSGAPCPSRPRAPPSGASRGRCAGRRPPRCASGSTPSRPPDRLEGRALGDALGVDVEPGAPPDGVRDAVEADPARCARGTPRSCSGSRRVSRVTGVAMSSSNGTTRGSPSSSPSGNGAVTLNPTPSSSTATRAVGKCSRSIVQGRRAGRRSPCRRSVARVESGVQSDGHRTVGAHGIPAAEPQQVDDRQGRDDGAAGRDGDVVPGVDDGGDRLADGWRRVRRSWSTVVPSMSRATSNGLRRAPGVVARVMVATTLRAAGAGQWSAFMASRTPSRRPVCMIDRR